jgi:hypothetical protein
VWLVLVKESSNTHVETLSVKVKSVAIVPL